MKLNIKFDTKATESDFQDYCRATNSDKKSMECRLIQRVLEMEMLGLRDPVILHDSANMAFAKRLTTSQLLELSSLLKSNWAVSITPDLSLMPSTEELAEKEFNTVSSTESLTFHYFNELLFNCAGNYRQIYNDASDPAVRLPLITLAALPTVALKSFSDELDSQGFLEVEVEDQSVANTIDEVQGILSQDNQIHKAIRQGASKQFLEYFFPQYPYFDSRSVTLLRTFLGSVKDPKQLPVKHKKALSQLFVENKKELDSQYRKDLVSFSEYKSQLFNYYFAFSLQNKISLKRLWKIEKDFSRKAA